MGSGEELRCGRVIKMEKREYTCILKGCTASERVCTIIYRHRRSNCRAPVLIALNSTLFFSCDPFQASLFSQNLFDFACFVMTQHTRGQTCICIFSRTPSVFAQSELRDQETCLLRIATFRPPYPYRSVSVDCSWRLPPAVAPYAIPLHRPTPLMSFKPRAASCPY